MKVNFEMFYKKKGMIVAIDDEGIVTIEMSVESVTKIIDAFDKYIMSGVDHDEIIEVTEFDETFKLDLSLKNEEDGFTLNGSILDNNFYHDFELDCCDIKTWGEIKKLCLSQ